MSSNTQSPKAPRREHMGCCLVQQVFAKAALDILATVSHHHKAGNGCTVINGDFRILEVVQCSILHCSLSCWRDIPSLVSTDEENLPCVGVLYKLQGGILADYQLSCCHPICALNVALRHDYITIDLSIVRF